MNNKLTSIKIGLTAVGAFAAYAAQTNICDIKGQNKFKEEINE